MRNFDFYKNLILEAAENDIEEGITAYPLQYIYDRFLSEKGWDLKRGSEMSVMCDWFQGLAINVPFTNYEILKLAKESNLIPQDASEDEEDSFLVMYFPNLARAFFRMSLEIQRGKNG